MWKFTVTVAVPDRQVIRRTVVCQARGYHDAWVAVRDYYLRIFPGATIEAVNILDIASGLLVLEE